MSGTIPRSPAQCGRCHALGRPCQDHKGPTGAHAVYKGPDVYDPSDWVRRVVGRRYKGWDGRTYTCAWYDPRFGFQMNEVAPEGVARTTNVSERAIDRTFHRVEE